MRHLSNFRAFVKGFKDGMHDPKAKITKGRVLDILQELETDLAAQPDPHPHAIAMAKLLEIDKYHFCQCVIVEYGKCANCKQKEMVLAAYRKDFP